MKARTDSHVETVDISFVLRVISSVILWQFIKERSHSHVGTVAKLICVMFQIATHVKTVHYGEKPLYCGECGHMFGVKQNLSYHVKIVHEKQFSCRACGKKICLKSALTTHVKQDMRVWNNYLVGSAPKSLVRRQISSALWR